MLFCPKCFLRDKGISSVIERNKYFCPLCGETFDFNDTLVSEQAIRAHIAIAPQFSKGMLDRLEEALRNEDE